MDKPWWTSALELERADRLDEAEKTIEDAMLPNYPAPLQIAEMYRMRVQRLLAEGRLAEAGEARRRALSSLSFYVACSTSGGEAAARMCEIEAYKAEIARVPGFEDDGN